MKKFLILTFALLLMGCAAPKIVYVPTEAETIIEYRDSIIHIKDTITVPIPVERVVEVVPELDTSRLETSIAYSEAFLDTESKKLRHTLRNKETALKGKLDTIVRVEYINKYIEKEVINEVEVPTPYIPKFAWFCIIFTCCWAVLKIAKIIWKFKGLK
jgi:hypothetical protein